MRKLMMALMVIAMQFTAASALASDDFSESDSEYEWVSEEGELAESTLERSRCEVKCVPRCVNRGIYGGCTDWGADFCGLGDVYCAEYCISRGSFGGCNRWGADQCYSHCVHY